MTIRTLLATACVLINVIPVTATAYSRFTAGGACPDGWRQPSDMDLHINTSNADGIVEAFQLAEGASAVANRVDTVNGQWFDYTHPYLVETSGYATGPGGDTNGNDKNELGLADLSALSSTGNLLGVGKTEVNLSTCRAIESDVFLDVNDSWDFGVPDDGRPTDACTEEDCYFDADDRYCSDGTKSEGCTTGRFVYWARPILLHEIGHTLGLAHSDHSYSYMNYNVLPWTNRVDEKQIEFLPDDRQALRDIYPGTADEIDAAVTTTWFDPTNTSNGAAKAFRLCKPSTGTGYSSDIFSETCGVEDDGSDGEMEVCPGATVYVRYAVSNYGTEELVVDEQLWFSKNTFLNRTAGADLKSPTDRADAALAPERAYRQGRNYRVPDGLDRGADYYPIMFLDSGADFSAEESQQNNWIPLRSKLRIKTEVECGDSSTVDTPEPGTGLGLCIGVLALATLRRRS